MSQNLFSLTHLRQSRMQNCRAADLISASQTFIVLNLDIESPANFEYRVDLPSGDCMLMIKLLRSVKDSIRLNWCF